MGKLKTWLCAGLVLCCAWFGGEVIAQQQSNEESSGRSSRSSRSSRASRNSSENSTQRGETTNDRDRRRESNSRSRESNSRSSSRSNRNNAAAATPAANGAAKTVEASKKPAAKSGGSSGGARPPVNITFEMQADPETNIMYLESMGGQPSLNIMALEKRPFTTRLALYNAKSSEFNQFDVSLKYDPQLIRPVGIDDSTLTGTLTSPATVLVDNRRGILSMSGDFRDTRNDSFMTLAKIQWRALAPAAATPIQFLNTERHPSGVFNKYGENILHAKTNDPMEVSSNTGLLNATVSIEPPDGEIDLAESSENPFSAVTLATNISMGTAEGGMRIALRPRVPAVSVGEEFLMDVVYQNPRRADLDTVKLDIRFDPAVLQVVDMDNGNWITRGINIFDGAYHDELPFDFHRKNQAFNTTGLIQYDMGFSSRTAVPAEGVIATIRFKAIAPASQTVVAFDTDFNRNAAAPPSQTVISFLGFNLLGKPGARASAIQNAAVTVR